MNSKELREKRAQLGVEIKRLAKLINDEGRAFTAEEQEAWDRINAEYDAIEAQLAIAVRAEKINSDLAARNTVVPGQDDFDGEQENRDAAGGQGNRPGLPTAEDRDAATVAWFRHQAGVDLSEEDERAAQLCGVNPAARNLRIPLLHTREARALSAELGATGANLVPPGFIVNLERALLWFGGMRQVSEILRTDTGNDLAWPTSDDTSNTGEQIGENTDSTETNIAVGQTILKAYKYSSKLVKVPVELLQDSAVDIPSLLGSMLGERLGRITNTKFTTGTGAGPEGITIGATTGVTTASSTAIAADELFDLIGSIDPAYLFAGVGFMMHQNIITAIRKLKDGMGQYLWQPGLTDGTPQSLLSYPLTLNQDMSSTITSTDIVILFGQLDKYKIRDVAEIRLKRLVERFADTDQEGFIALSRNDGRLLDAGTNPVKTMVMKT